MDNKMFKLVLKALGLTMLAVIISYYVIGNILVVSFGYSTVEASYHLPTHALLIGLMFTIIFCTMVILNRLKNR